MIDEASEDDATLVRRIAEERDEHALSDLMERHAPQVTGYLRHRFRHQLQHADIDEVVNRAALKLWKKANRFNLAKPFGPWFLGIAHRTALDLLKGEKREEASGLEIDPRDPLPECAIDKEELSPKTAWYMEQLEQITDDELRGFEQIVVRADIAAGGPGEADTDLLMKQHKKTKNVVHATRSKVWKKVRQIVIEREILRDEAEVAP